MADPSVDDLEKTTFSGRRFTRKQLAQIQETVRLFPNLSRKELATTLCEHLKWTSPNGAYKIHSCYALLDELERRGILRLPARRETRAPRRGVRTSGDSRSDPPVEGSLASISPLELHGVTTPEERGQWNAYVEQYHYLGYRHPFGAHLCYFVVSRPLGQRVGCLLFSASAAWAMAPRDVWIGWNRKQRQKGLPLILSNDRFLIFPWVNVPNLASASLALATRQIGGDWERVYGYRPVLVETFVDTTRYAGTCYQAANWQRLGQTQGRGFHDPEHRGGKTRKDIYVYPLEPGWRNILTGGSCPPPLKKRSRSDRQSSRPRTVDDRFLSLWEKGVRIISDVAAHYDGIWRLRRRAINSMLIILLIFRLICSRSSQSYGTAIDELWDSCDRLRLPLPQKSAVASSSFCVARRKLDETVFKDINQRIIALHNPAEPPAPDGWRGHRLFAVDGTKINLPRPLLAAGYRRPTAEANYPQGLVSCLYDLTHRIPVDFDLVSHSDERACARQHLAALRKGDIVVYDRGYFSYDMLHRHLRSGVHAIFRLQESTFPVIERFFAGSETDQLVSICPASTVRNELSRKYPEIDVVPLEMRLLKYRAGKDTFCLGTTLTDRDRYPNLKDFADLYHERWGVEELYKVSKRLLDIEAFHARTERGVKQEVFAHFALITMNRIFANQAEEEINPPLGPGRDRPDRTPGPSVGRWLGKVRTNFKNCLRVFSEKLEELILVHDGIRNTVAHVFHLIVGRCQRERPGRSFERRSMRPETKWHARTKPPKRKKALPALENAATT